MKHSTVSMLNRLTLPLRLGAFVLALASSSVPAFAQQSFFNFTPPPPTVVVGPDCLGSVSDGPLPTVVPLSPGASITVSQMNQAATGFAYTDDWPAGTTHLIVWSVADNQGHTADFDFGVTFIDATGPVFDVSGVPSPLLVNSIAQVPALGPLPVTDNCSGPGQITQNFSQTTPPPLCQAGTFVRTWMATDILGNATTYTQQIQVFRDSILPTITVAPVGTTVNCATLPASYTNWLNAQMAAFTATDASGTPTYSNNAPPTLAACPGPQVVQFRANDQCGLFSSVTVTFSTSDNQPPNVVVEPQDTIAYCGNHLARLGEFIQTHAYSTVTDPCSPNLTWVMLVNGQVRDSLGVQAELLASFANPCGVQLIGSQTFAKVRGYVRVDFFAYDACDNERFVGQGVFGVIDTTPPVITGPAITTEECGGSNDQAALEAWINAYGNATTTDVCSVSPGWTNFSFTTSNGQSGSGNFGVGPYPTVQPNTCTWYTDVTFRAADDCGNVGQKTLQFRISDLTPPSIGGFADTTFVYCPSPIPNSFSATATDNCATGISPTYTTQFADTSCVGNYSLKVFWSAADACGNVGTRTQIIAIRDTTGPDFGLVPAGFTADCATYTTLPPPVSGTDVTATDACGALQGISFSNTNNQNPNPNTCAHYNFDITRTFVATDVCGNTRTATQVIAVRDQQGPFAVIPLPDTLILCQNLPLVAAIPPAADACSPVPAPATQLSQTIVAGNCPDEYTIVVTWQASDVCGNLGTFSRNFLVRDTVQPTLSGLPSNVTVDCNNIPAPPALNSLITNDNCDALPGVAFAETRQQDPNPANCAHWSNYAIVRNWTISDACGNARTYTQVINVMDDTGPELAVRDTVAMPAASGQCGANVLPPSPLSVFDLCSSLAQSATLRDTTPITGPPSSTIVCDTVFLALNAGHLPPLQPVAAGGATLNIFLDNADAEGAQEFFHIFGENGTLLGTTVATPTQCGSSVTTLSVPANLLNNWLADGQLQLTLAPNGTGAAAINPICPGRQVRAELTYQYLQPQIPVSITYQIDNGPVAAYPTNAPTFLATGIHTVRYVATDCAGNTRSATSVIRIDDIEPPLVAAPATQTWYVGATNCTATDNLLFPNITENCVLSGILTQSSPVTTTLFEADDNAGLVPQMLTLTVSGLIPNAVSGGVLKIRHRGDHGNVGEFFQVFDENNVQLSTTTTSAPGVECSPTFHETNINITAAQINAWAANGNAQIKLVPNTDAVNFVDWINPCGPLSGGSDGQSAVQAIIEYRYAIVSFQIKNNTNTVVASGQLVGNQNVATLPPGQYTVTYSTPDAAGNLGAASYALTVRDTVRPTAICQNRTIFVSVTGSTPYTLTPAEVNNGSTDNCSGANLTLGLSQTSFSCNQSGQIIAVTLTVTDAASNTRTCVAQIRVETDTIATDASSDVCEGGTAQLFANPPGNPANYTYLWTGPNGYTAIQQNPILNNVQLTQEGTYTVRVTGPTGCTATGLAQLQLVGLPFQPTLSVSATQICAGQNVTLTTNAYAGTSVAYEWYQTNLGTLLATTTQPNFTVTNPAAGNYQYFVRVIDLDCASSLSSPRAVVVQARPAATVANAMLSVCEGSPVQLQCTTPSGPGVTYAWSGPNAFTSNAAMPTVFNAVTASAGTYSVTVSANGCAGTPATVSLTVLARPAAPTITGTSQVCEGATVTLTAQPPVGMMFGWVSPDLDTTFTAINSLILNNVAVSDSGFWKVYTTLNGCQSATSVAQLVEVQAYPNVVANGNTPLCQGNLLYLEADVDQAASGLSFTWTGPGGFSAFSQNPTDLTPESGNYIVQVGTTFGCTRRDTLAVNFVAPPIITSITSNAPPCVNDTTDITLFQTVVSPNGPFTYLWTYPNGTQSSLPNLLISNASTADNGDYTLVVTDKFGCASSLSTYNLSVQETPPLPIIALPAPVCTGAPLTLQLSNQSDFTGLPATFLWEVNGQPYATTQPVLSLGNANGLFSGDATVQVIVGSCVSTTSAAASVVVYPQPISPSVLTNSPVCAGDTLFFSPQVPPGVLVDAWQWAGPVGFTSAVANPIITPVGQNNAGEYTLRVTINGCLSTPGEPIPVTIKPKPQKPTALFDAAVCNEQNDTLTLRVATGTQTPGAQYQWFRQPAQTPISPPSFSPVLRLTDFSTYPPGQNGFYVVALLDGCESDKSFNVSVKFDTIPDVQANAGNDFIACTELNLFLQAVAPSPTSITGRWSQVSGPLVSIQQPNNFATLVDGSGIFPNNTYQFAWTLSNGACESYDSDTINIGTVAFTAAQARANFDTCFAESIQLSALQNPLANGYWTQPLGQSAINIQITNPADPNTTVTNLPQGATNLFYFIWNVNSLTCGTSVDTVVVRNISARPVLGIDQRICSTNDCLPLSASELGQFETGQWLTNDPSVVIASPGSPLTQVCGLETGTTQFVWQTNNGLCGDRSRDTIQITYEVAPIAVPDTLYVPFGNQLNINVLNNDTRPSLYDVTVTQQPTNGQWAQLNEGLFAYRPDITFSGVDKLVYTLCNLNCPDTSQVRCDVATVSFIVGESDGCDVPTVITPNGDLINDVFFVPCLACADCPQDNEVHIYNQWGDQVFEASPYLQNWDGTYDGQPLPPGTYFWVIKYNSEANRPVARGFVVIQR
jgi:gliding motility-associated-like protein